MNAKEVTDKTAAEQEYHLTLILLPPTDWRSEIIHFPPKA
jgi:hypothetical protein